MTALDDLIPWDRGLHIKVAAAINSSGQIAATADSQGSPNVGVLLTPVARPVGDINGNCRVDVDDLLMLLFDWGATGSPADLDGDGVVGVRDFLALLADWT
jgi:hypothetical protein